MELQWLVLVAIILSTILWTEIRLSGKAQSRRLQRAYRESFSLESNPHNQIIMTLLNTLFEKNPREEQHSERVAELCVLIGKSLGLNREQLEELKLTGLLHDIGKIVVDEAILNKATNLDEREWKHIQRHPVVGYRLLNFVPGMSSVAAAILAHHERWDGTGYPRGLKGEEIPVNARIVAVADAYDAMVSFRPYRNSLTHEEAVEELQQRSGTQFDPRIIQAFVTDVAKEKALDGVSRQRVYYAFQEPVYAHLVVE
ncbi:MAG: HD-GYP domain-containing protein [Firmicutes bacterium]|nr:HD-GYP domain-containing protein [Bacillota bacterium]